MAKIKLTKGELKKQRDALKQFRHYLPTLQLKKRQLQIKISEARNLLNQKQAALEIDRKRIMEWVGLLADKTGLDMTQWILPTGIVTETVNIAGAKVPIFKQAKFTPAEYDFYTTPFWLDQGIRELKSFISVLAEIAVVKRQVEILKQELRITTQRVNLFEKVKIPECIDNIRVIRIYLGDQQANAVGISKVAKKKIEIAKNKEVVLV